MQNKHALLEKLKIIEFKYLGNGLRYWREILAVFYSTLEKSFPELSLKNSKKVGPVTNGLKQPTVPWQITNKRKFSHLSGDTLKRDA